MNLLPFRHVQHLLQKEHWNENKPQFFKSKVIMLTGAPSAESQNRAEALHVHSYIAKPIRASALIEVVEEAAAQN